ncbi:hypothetical protein VTO42DRAFT_6056 [Malbranchea cinnamomea]
MPHKHRRRQKDDDKHFDLPPTVIAKPLPVRETKTTSNKTKKKTKKKEKGGYNYQDDTPKEFKRLMSRLAQTPSNPSSRSTPSGPDDGKKQQGRKRKRSDADESADKNLKILPGERLSDFAARVDQALPLSGISKKSGYTSTDPRDVELRKLREERQTRHEKKLRSLQEEWRKEEARIREKEEEERDEREAEQEEIEDLWRSLEAEAGGSILTKKKKGKSASRKKRKKTGAVEDSDDDDDDPWAKLNRKKAHASRPINPLETAKAPPENLVKPKEVFKVRGIGGAKVDVANVPAAAGSLRRREELASERKNIVEQYRKLMASKRS